MKKLPDLVKNIKVPKEEVINVRCTMQQKAEIEAVATSMGLGVSTWLLQLGLVDAQARKEKERR